MRNAREIAKSIGYLDEDIRGVAIDPDGTVIVTVEGSEGEPIQQVYDLESGEAV